MKLYQYKNCGTCQKAIKYLKAKNIDFEAIPIREHPPTIDEIKRMAQKYPMQRLFNTSGRDYREHNIKDKLPNLTEDQIFHLLNKNGNLIKRPFLISDTILLIGFKQDEWDDVF